MLRLTYIPESELEKLPRVRSSSIKKGKHFHPEGIFSEQIFGPINSYKCQCKEVTAAVGQTCPKCGVQITSSIKRRTQFAVIEVERLINPVVMEMLLFSSISIKKIISQILAFKKALYINDNTFNLVSIDEKTLNITTNEDIEIDESKVTFGLDAIYELACLLVADENRVSKSKVLSYIREAIHKEEFFTKYVIVIPPDFRPAIINSGKVFTDEINKLYLSILTVLENKYYTAGMMKKMFDCKLQQLANQLNKYVFDALSGKEGLVRGRMSGKRIDFSGRSVIVVNPELPLSHIGVSRLILLQLWKLEIASTLVKQNKFITFKSAMDYLQRIYETSNIPPEITKLIDELATDKFVIFNRQPSLHRSSMFAAKVKPTSDMVIELNPLHCPPLNADFDGDSIYGNVTLEVETIDGSQKTTVTANITDLYKLTVFNTNSTENPHD